jgi:hypothetical protein
MKIYFPEKIHPPSEYSKTYSVIGTPDAVYGVLGCEDDGAYGVGNVLDPIAKALNGTSDHEFSCSYWYFKSEKMAKEFIRRVNVHLNRVEVKMKEAFSVDSTLLTRSVNKDQYPEEA